MTTTNVVKLGSLAKFIKIASKLHLLPLKVDYRIPLVEFNFISINTLVNFIIFSLPFLGTVILWACQAQYITEVIYALPEIYSKIDLGAMGIYPGINMVSLPLFLINCLNCKTFTSVQEISSDKNMKFPRNSGIIITALVLNLLRCDIRLMISTRPGVQQCQAQELVFCP